jgi:GTP diphosphokinase / guanosine-3',5'-bis(diphosphate) 3'-diphosphatase
MADIDTLVQRVLSYYPQADATLIRSAYDFAAKAHAGQLRASGEPYIVHPLETAVIVAGLYLDLAAVSAALLHDVPEDTPVGLDGITKAFGPEVAKLVDGVTKLSRISWGSIEEEQAESLRKMFLAMVDDVRVVLIKLSDRLHNMRTLGALPPDRQRKIAQETMEIYAPLASRLGIWQFKWELEDLAFKALNPDKYHELAALLDTTQRNREHYIGQAMATLQQALEEQDIQAQISGRPKHIYSIYRKMQRKHREFEQIYDLLAIRLIVDSVKDCYAALGIVHSLWRPIPGEFDDYIAMPKENLYQSLHTAVIFGDGLPLEVQIRTQEMHRLSEYGIAAHWRYKEGTRRDINFESKIAWLRQLMEWRRDIADATEFVESLKTDIFRDQVYVFTPKGDIIDLPAGSTPVDFAYRIHSDIGHRCRGSKVNGRLVALDYQLQNGDRIEILTAKQGGPSRDWLNQNLGFIKSHNARDKVRAWFKREQREENVVQGKESLDHEIRRLSLEQSAEDIARLFKFDKLDDFYAAIGCGDIEMQAIASKLIPQERPLPKAVTPVNDKTGIRVMGVGDLLTRLGTCCKPLPGDAIVGYITRGRGVTVHRQDCPNVQKVEEGRLVPVAWGQSDHYIYPVSIRIEALNRDGLLRDVTSLVAEDHVDITLAKATVHPDQTATITATLQVTGMDQVSRILAKIEGLRDVLEVRRDVVRGKAAKAAAANGNGNGASGGNGKK